jgi:multisubunit Na+/H+ antiporter MnhC subunit
MDTGLEQSRTPVGASLEAFVVTAAVTGAAAAALLVGLTWKHLRAKQISPADGPIMVE